MRSLASSTNGTSIAMQETFAARACVCSWRLQVRVVDTAFGTIGETTIACNG
jgi:hypothetical protein